uniref:Putative ovule protein n=1 Tax=Solanum chacoense TaxID=4108 RepID=A0A0V0H2R0_SOLCH
MGDSTNFASKHQVFDVSVNVTESKRFDDDGRIKRTGSVWTASAHIITAVIGSGVLSLAWAVAQLGWIAGPIVMLLFSFVTYYTSSLLSDCYRSGDPLSGKRNYTYMDAVQANLGMSNPNFDSSTTFFNWG